VFYYAVTKFFPTLEPIEGIARIEASSVPFPFTFKEMPVAFLA
jgi:hypothetical protein